MVKQQQQLLREFSRVGKGNSQFSSISLGDYDYNEEELEDDPIESDEMEDSIPQVKVTSENIEMQEKLNRRPSCEEPMPTIVLMLLYLEKFVDIAVVFIFTLLAVLWPTLHSSLQGNFWPLVAVSIILIVVLVLLYRVKWIRRFPGCFVYKLISVQLVILIFFILAVHFPVALPFLSPYFSLIAAGTVGATYILFAFVSVTHKRFCKIDAKGCTLWRYGFVTPIFVLVFSQPVFLCFGHILNISYSSYLANVGVGVLTSLPFIYETLFIYHRFVNSKQLEEFVNTTGLWPGFVTSTFGKHLETDGNIDEASKHCRA